MRGRKKEPDGRRVTICAKVSEAEAAAIDEARGDASRSEWMRLTALAAVSVVAPGEEVTRVRSFALAPDSAPKTEPKSRAKGKCEHRIPPGSFCTRCERLI